MSYYTFPPKHNSDVYVKLYRESRDCKMLKKFLWQQENMKDDMNRHIFRIDNNNPTTNYGNYVPSTGVPFKSMSKEEIENLLKSCKD